MNRASRGTSPNKLECRSEIEKDESFEFPKQIGRRNQTKDERETGLGEEEDSDGECLAGDGRHTRFISRRQTG